MTLNQQTANFPSFHQPEMGWSENLKAALNLLVPGSGVRSGLNLGIPVSGGLTPTLTDGWMVAGDKVLGPYGSKLISPAPKNATKRLYFGLSGLYYGDAPAKPTDALLGQVTTDNESAASITSVAQPLNYGGCRFGIRGEVNLAKCPKGADIPLFTWRKPVDIGLGYVRVSFAAAAVKTVAVGAEAADNFILGLTTNTGDSTLVTLTGTELGSAASKASATPGEEGVTTADQLLFTYNQTDAAPSITAGVVEFVVTIEVI